GWRIQHPGLGELLHCGAHGLRALELLAQPIQVDIHAREGGLPAKPPMRDAGEHETLSGLSQAGASSIALVVLILRQPEASLARAGVHNLRYPLLAYRKFRGPFAGWSL